MIALFPALDRAYPIVSIEDGLDENDWEGVRAHDRSSGRRVQIVGDDIFVTNPAFIGAGITEKAANAVLIKLNQIGTVSETIQTMRSARRPDGATSSRIAPARPRTLHSRLHGRHGRRPDQDWFRCRGERIAKYNRLLEIEMELGDNAVFFAPFSF